MAQVSRTSMRQRLSVLVGGCLALLGGTTDASSTPAAAVTDVCGRLRMPDDSKLNTTRITLDDGEYTAYTKEVDGSFCFYNVGPGVHLLDVQSNHLMFSQVKVQLLKDAMNDPKFVEYPYAGAAKFPLTKLILTAHASYEFFQPKPGFSPFTMLKNPMVLMMIVSIGLMFLMPKMMEGLDPEQQEQMRQQMKNQQDPTKMLSQLFSGEEETPTKKISSGKKTRRMKRE